MVLENTRLCTNIAPKFQIPEKLREPVLNWHTGTAHKKHQSTNTWFIYRSSRAAKRPRCDRAFYN